MKLLSTTFYGNTFLTWGFALLIAILSVVLLRILQKVLLSRLSVLARKTRTELDDLVVDLFKKTKLFFLLFLGVFIGSLILTLPEGASRIIRSLTVIAFLIQAAIWGNGVISFSITRYMRRKMEEDATSATTIGALGFISKLILWTIILLLALDNLGVDITTLVAGLGVGGIAVALAVQNILGDLFASLSIVLDKPFVIGDFVIVDEYLGSVEHIGLKTTRIRSLSGEQIVFSNSDLLNSRVRNYKRMYERRVLFSIGVTYQTPYEKLAKIPSIIREIIEAQEAVRFDRAHFKQYGDFSLNYEIVYYVQNPDYKVYMDTQQAINLAIFKRFEEEAIEFAYPTQTLFINKEAS